ncbi:MAG: hypothetical protein IT366_04225 [Candidatus Hydrogenedentes bacterium]|nr:hypothetical protein [Candidatus Hydrogenedentota bacterium]
MFRTRNLACFLSTTIVAFLIIPLAPAEKFTFRPYLDPDKTLNASLETIDGQDISINGVDTAAPSEPFTFDWGDGATSNAWFPAQHTYQNTNKNYTVRVTAHYSGGATDFVEVFVRFKPVNWSFVADPTVPDRFDIPSTPITPVSTLPGYLPPDGTQIFAVSDIGASERSAVEYAMSVAHWIQLRYVHENVTSEAAGAHAMLKQTTFPGSLSFWYTQPPTFTAHPDYLAGEIYFSSLFHEAGHIMTLNCPASFRMGGKIDGNMNAIFSEGLAGVFQHATAYEILNTKGRFGLPEDVLSMIKFDAIKTVVVARQSYARVFNGDSVVTTYNDPNTVDDETFNTFLTVVYVFVDLAETQGNFRKPLQRTMELFETFNQSDATKYQQPDNESFRSTYWVAALSYGFKTDLRDRFRDLGFPVKNKIYRELKSRVK